jgi:hypothetical protein
VTIGSLIRRSLTHYWRTGALVALGVAVASATLTGSLIVGASVRGSLRERALARLGNTTHALIGARKFRLALSADLAHDPALQGHITRWAPTLELSGVAENADTNAVAPRVKVLGVSAPFWGLFPGSEPPKLAGRKVAVNSSLARDLTLVHQSALLIYLERRGTSPAGTLFAQQKREKTVQSIRLEVESVLPDAGAGGFALSGSVETPRNIFVSYDWLANVIQQESKANLLAVEARTGDPGLGAALTGALNSTCIIADLGLKLATNAEQGYVSLQSTEVVLNENEVRAGLDAAAECGGLAALTSVYLADSVRVMEPGKPESAYAIVAAAEPLRPMTFREGGQSLGRDGIWLNTWLAEDLGARAGSKLELEYLIPTRDGVPRKNSLQLTVRGIVELQGAAGDPGLTPLIEGITEAKRLDEWSLPFPIRRERIRQRDEDYWTQHRTTPKAFVDLVTAESFWMAGPHGQAADWVTSLRVKPPEGEDLNAFAARLEPVLRRKLTPAVAGLAFRPLREEALRGSAGTTDFSQLFVGLSFFIVIAAAALAGVLMRLLAERRAAEMGLCLGCGFSQWKVLGMVVGEGAVLSVAGALLGVPFGFLYAWGLLAGLRSFWAGAVAGTPLGVYADGMSILLGALCGLLAGLASVAWGAWVLRRRRVLDLLAGWRAQATWTGRSQVVRVIVLLAGQLVLAAALVALSAGWHMVSPQVAFFGGGAVLLLAGLSACYLLLARAWAARGTPSLLRLAVRSAASQRRRSLLVIGLLAAATFVLVTVASQRRDITRLDVTNRRSGAGGFTLRAVSALPILYDFGTPAGRAQLGFEPADEEVFKDVEVVSFLVSPGDDISCLNLARPAQPRVLAVSPQMRARGGFGLVGVPRVIGWHRLVAPAPEPLATLPVFGDAASVRWTLHSGLKEVYDLPVGGRSVLVRFAGVLPASIFAGEILMAEENFRRLFPGADAPRYFLIATPAGREEAVAHALRKHLGGMGLEVRSTREILAAYLSVQNTYLSVFLALGGLGLLLGTVGLVAVLLRAAFERRAEFALMLATGFQPAAILRLMVLEHIGLLLAGLAVGALTALVAVSPALRAHESQVNWPTLLGTLAAILIFGVGCCALGARAATRGTLIEALRGE